MPALVNRNILVTRPQGRADKLCQLINDAGGRAIHYPVIEILPPLDNRSLLNIKEYLYQYDIAIFISPTAVLQTANLLPLFPEHLQVAAIGSKTASMLEDHYIPVTIQTDGHNSESLLTHPALQAPAVTNMKILIFRGEGGRAFLGNSLIHRGAQVRYVESYRRALPVAAEPSTNTLKQLDAITISSNEGLDNLMLLVKNPDIILNIPVIVASDKTVTNACSYGFNHVHLAENATDEACFAQLRTLFYHHDI